MPKLRNGSNGDSKPRDCESGILPLSYHATTFLYTQINNNNDVQGCQLQQTMMSTGGDIY